MTRIHDNFHLKYENERWYCRPDGPPLYLCCRKDIPLRWSLAAPLKTIVRKINYYTGLLVGVLLKLRINLISLYAEVELNKFVTISWKPSGKLENPYKPNKRILYLQMMFDLEVSLIGLFPPLPSLPGFSLCLPLLSPLPSSNRLWYFIKGWLLHFYKQLTIFYWWLIPL